jgi:hypothetical protein
MKHPRGLIAALLLTLIPAACVDAQAAVPFPVVDTTPPPEPSHALSNACLAAGVLVIGSSFLFEHQADRAYDAYLVASDPGDITTLYDRTILYDRLSAGALIGGNVLIATGLYLRFVHHPPPERLRFALGPQRCSVTCVF